MREGTSISEYVLSRTLPDERVAFEKIVKQLNQESSRSYALADLSDLLESLSPARLGRAVAEPPPIPAEAVWANYVAAMVETAIHRKQLKPPEWVADIAPLDEPWFATKLKSLRLHLLCESPPAFRRRNLFIDATLGDRV